MLILGIDPSITATGIALVEINPIGKSLVIRSMTAPDRPKLDLLPRIFDIAAEIEGWCDRDEEDELAVAIEYNIQTTYRDARGVTKNKSPASLTGQANLIGAIAMVAMSVVGSDRVHLVNPKTAKKALVGHGGASKPTVVKYAQLRTDWSPPKSKRAQQAEADAIAVAFAGFRPYRQLSL